MLYSKEIDSIGDYDAVVVGGGASGVCAAVSPHATLIQKRYRQSLYLAE